MGLFESKPVVWSILAFVIVALIICAVVWYGFRKPEAASVPTSPATSAAQSIPTVSAAQIVGGLPPGLPLLAGGGAVLASATTTRTGATEYGLMFTSPKSVQENYKLYTAYFLSRGWQAHETSSEPASATFHEIVYTDSSRTVTLVLNLPGPVSSASVGYLPTQIVGSLVNIEYTK